MKYLKQLGIVLFFSLVGEILQRAIPLPIPASIYGLLLLFISLCSGIVKIEKIRGIGEFLIAIMPIMFVGPAVNLLGYWRIIAPNIIQITILIIISTIGTFVISGIVTQKIIQITERRKSNE